MKKPFISNWIVRNLLLAVVIVLVCAGAADFLLARYTRHGDMLVVPDFSGLDAAHASDLAASSGLCISISDSVNVRGVPAGTVVKQNPAALSCVKPGRRIHLTLNAVSPKMLPMPNLVGSSLRSAAAELTARGLNLKRLVYVDDIATNNVLRQECAGRPVSAGTLLPGGSYITLYLGLNEDDNQTVIPDLSGLDCGRAVARLHESSLNVDRLVFDRSVKTYLDSMSCVVSGQFPEYSGNGVLMGTAVTLWFSPSAQTPR